MKENNAVKRAKAVIYKRLETLDKKIENARERWPEDMYGGKCFEKISDYQEEQEYLGNFLNNLSAVEKGLAAEDRNRRSVFEQKLLLIKVCDTLCSYGEIRLAERVRKQIKLY
jgi:hypothetical protein